MKITYMCWTKASDECKRVLSAPLSNGAWNIFAFMLPNYYISMSKTNILTLYKGLLTSHCTFK